MKINQSHRKVKVMKNHRQRINKAMRIMNKAHIKVSTRIKTMKLVVRKKMLRRLNSRRPKSRKSQKQNKTRRKSRLHKISKFRVDRARLLKNKVFPLKLKNFQFIRTNPLTNKNLQFLNLNIKTFPSHPNNKQTDHY